MKLFYNEAKQKSHSMRGNIFVFYQKSTCACAYGLLVENMKPVTNTIQVTLDGCNSDLSKQNCGPISFIQYITKQIYSQSLELPIFQSSQTLKLSPRSRYTLFIVFNLQSLEVLIVHTRLPIEHIINTHWAIYQNLNNGDHQELERTF